VSDIYRVRSAWTGFIGAPGVTTMYFLDVATAVAAIHTFWTDIHTYLQDDTHIQVENAGDIIDDATGELTGAWTAEAVTEVTGTISDAYAAPVGAVVNWLTDTIADGRRLRGKTFLVPMANRTFAADGTLATDPRAMLVTAGNAFIEAQSTSFVVWHRGSGSDGSAGLVTSCTVPDRAAVLRSRRD